MFGYQKNSNIQAKGARPNGQKVTHVVSSTMMTGLLRSLLRDKLCEGPWKDEMEIQVQGEFLSPDLPQVFMSSTVFMGASRVGFLWNGK